MKRIMLVVAGVLLLGACATEAKENPLTGEPVVHTVAAPTTTEAPTTTAAPRDSDDGWGLEQLTVEADGAGSYSGMGRVQNTADESRTGVFTITFFDDGGQVLGSMQGVASKVGDDETATVQFVSTDDYEEFDHIEFQTDATYAD